MRRVNSIRPIEIVLLIGFCALKLFLNSFLVHEDFELHRDEFLYLDQGKHLAWGFVSVPPALSLFSHLILWLELGEYFVRAFGSILGCATLIVVWLTAKAMGSGITGRLLASWLFLFSGFLRLNILYQPNSLDALCFSLLFLFLIKFLNTSKNIHLYGMAVVAGLGFLSKYTILVALFFVFLTLIYLKRKEVFRSKTYWVSLLIFLAIISPNVIWQSLHDFPVFHHLQVLAKDHLAHSSLSEFVLQQLMFPIGGFFVPLIVGYALIFKDQFKQLRPVGFIILTSFGLFALLASKPYYAFSLFPCLFAMAGYVIEGFKINRLLNLVFWISPIVALFFLMNMIFPLQSVQSMVSGNVQGQQNKFKWEDGSEHPIKQDFADMLGWKELSALVSQALKQSPDPEKTLILCENYGQAGSINFYLRKPGLPLDAVSHHADYKNWFPEKHKVNHLIYVSEKAIEPGEWPFVFNAEHSPKYIGQVVSKYSREKGASVYLIPNGGSLAYSANQRSTF
jgi:hypothetical protein